MKLVQKNSKNYLFLMLLILFFTLNACHGKSVDSSHAPFLPPTVAVSNPLQAEVPNFVTFSGMTEAFKSATIQARREGVLEKIYFIPGTIVEKGDLLFSINSEQYEVNLKKAKAELVVRDAELKVAEKSMNRLKKAYTNNAVSEIAIIEAEAKLSITKAYVEAAKADVDTAQLDLSYTMIEAPIDGRINRSFVDEGNLLRATDQTVLTSITQTNPIYAYFRISEQELFDYQYMLNSQPFGTNKIPVFLGLAGQDDYPWEGYVDYIDNNVDTGTGTIHIRAIFLNTAQTLLAGTFVRIKLPLGKPSEELLIPDEAFGLDQQGKYLLLVNSENEVYYQPVTIGTLINGMRVVTKGLSSNDLVVINGIQKAIPGFPVTPKKEILSMVIEASNTIAE